MGNGCRKPNSGSGNIVTASTGRYIASAVSIDSVNLGTNNNNNSEDVRNKNFKKTNRNGAVYVLTHGDIKPPDNTSTMSTVENTNITIPEVPIKNTGSKKDDTKKQNTKKEEDKKGLAKTNSKETERISPKTPPEDPKPVKVVSEVPTPPVARPTEAAEKPRTAKPEKQSKVQPYSLKQLRKAFFHDFQTFLLNNTLLAVQFGPERELFSRARSTTPGSPGIDTRQNEMCQRLSLTGHYKRAICPDALHEQIATMVRFCPAGAPGSSPGPGVPLRPVRVMICHEDVEVIDQEHVYSDTKVADQIPIIRIRLEQAAQPGYVKLCSLDSTVLPQARSSMTESYGTEDNDYSRLSDFEMNNTPSTCGRNGDDISSSSSVDSEAEDTFDSSPRERKTTVEIHSEVDPNNSKGRFKAKLPTSRSIGDLNVNVKNVSLENLTEKLQHLDIGDDNMSRSKSSPNIQKLNVNNNIKPAKSMDKLNEKRKFGPQSRDFSAPTPTERRHSEIIGTMNRTKTKSRNTKRPIQLSTSPQTGSNSSNDSSGYKSISNPGAHLNVPGSHRSNDSTSDSEYGYSTIANLNTPQTLEERRQRMKQTGVALKIGLPSSCFIPVTYRYLDEDGTSDDLFKTKPYLSSQSFMDNFSHIFGEILAADLGFSPNAIHNATVCGASITCHTTTMKLEIIPTVNCPYPNWPEKAVEWLLRARPKAFDQRTQEIYTWPTQDMIQNARSKGYHLIPLGYAPRRGGNPNLHLEWTIEFPEAEKYLETCLKHVQLRSYIFSLILFQSFFGVADSVDENHLRHVIFWQAENFALAWANFEMYNNIRAIFQYLYVALSKENLPNYFIRRRNEFQSIPRGRLREVQRKIHDFRENPFGHILAALKHVTYVGNHYPVLDYDRLLELITAKFDVELLNPALRGMMATPAEQPKNKKDSDTESVGFWADVKRNNDPQRKWNEKFHKKVEEEKKLAKEKAKIQSKPQDSSSILNQPKIEINVSKFNPNAIRRRLILELYISHFIKLARKSLEYKLRSQTLEYLAHTENLYTLMKENGGAEEDKLIEIREQLDDIFQSLSVPPPPQTRLTSTLPRGTALARTRKPLQLPKNATELFNEFSHASSLNNHSEIDGIQNWKLQRAFESDFSEAPSTDIEVTGGWHGSRLKMRDAPPTMIFLDGSQDGESTDL